MWKTLDERTRHGLRLMQLKLGYLTYLLFTVGSHMSALCGICPDSSWQCSVPIMQVTWQLGRVEVLFLIRLGEKETTVSQNLCTANIQCLGVIFQGFCLISIFASQQPSWDVQWLCCADVLYLLLSAATSVPLLHTPD